MSLFAGLGKKVHFLCPKGLLFWDPATPQNGCGPECPECSFNYTPPPKKKMKMAMGLSVALITPI